MLLQVNVIKKMNYTKIKTERQFRSTTGYSKKEFDCLHKDLQSVYYDLYGQTYQDYVAENVTEVPVFSNLGEILFFVLFQLKNNLVYDCLGAVFNMNGSTAHKNFAKFSILLEQTLEKKK